MNSQDSNTRQEFRLKTFQSVVSLVVAAGFVAGAVFFFYKLSSDDRTSALAFGGFLLALGAILATTALRSRLILDGDWIEVHSTFRTHRAQRGDIEGTRKNRSRNGSWTRLYLKGGGGFNVSDSFQGKEAFQEWLRGVPDLDQRDADEIQRQIDALQAPGATLEGGSKVLPQAGAWNIGLCVLAVLAGLVAFFIKSAARDMGIATLVLLPLAGVYLVNRFPLSFTVFRRKPDPRTDLSILLMGCGFGLLFLIIAPDVPAQNVDATRLIYWGIAIIVCFMAPLFRSAWTSPSRIRSTYGLLFLSVLYAFGAVNAVNRVPDRSAPHWYSTQVTGKHESHGRSTSYYLSVAPWGPDNIAENVSVSQSMYEAAQPGDPLCAGLHPGFLKAQWYTLSACPPGAVPQP